ncbi:MAG: hypothetical protein JXR91_16115 [Deltaproteobacteria bacterium]|nr:hypothetical protein [Deltaproteobacteria bacterium]
MKQNLLVLIFLPLLLLTISRGSFAQTDNIHIPSDYRGIINLPPKHYVYANQSQTHPEESKNLKARLYKQALHKISKLPPVQKIIDSALNLASNNITRGVKWKKYSRRAALLPELRVSGGFDGNRDENLTVYQTKPDQWGARTDRDYGTTISLTWRLNELVFNQDELAVERALEDLSDSRQALITSITGYYFELKKLIIMQIVSPPEELTMQIELEMHIEEIKAWLNAISGGVMGTPNLY